MMKKYQTGGNVGSSRSMMNALRTLNMKQQSGRQMGDIWQQRVMGEAREDLQKKVEEWQRKMERQQKKSAKKFKALKFLDLVPGGKWVKTAIKGGLSYGEADKFKSLLNKAGNSFGDFSNTFLGKSAGKLALQYKDSASDIDPLKALLKSVTGDILGGKMGETFGEAFAGKTETGLKLDSGSKFTGDPLTTNIDVAGKAGGIGFNPGGSGGGLSLGQIETGATPWKDQFRSQFGLGEGDKFMDLFKPFSGEFDEGTGRKFLGKWQSFMHSPFMLGQSTPDVSNTGQPIYDDITGEPTYEQGNTMFEDYIGSQFDKPEGDMQSIYDMIVGR